jgi:hypothetical protein
MVCVALQAAELNSMDAESVANYADSLSALAKANAKVLQ